jgi:hypothetical protein
MKAEDIIAFAKKEGYARVNQLDDWRGFKVYEPIPDYLGEGEIEIVGFAPIILVKDDVIRMSTQEESVDQIMEA